MSRIRQRIEAGFETFARWVYHNRLKMLAASILLTGLLISQIPKITIDTSTEGFLHKSDPTLIDYNKFRDQFGRDEVIIVAIKSSNIFRKAFLNKLQKLHRELKDNVPYIDDITSLINARNTRGTEDELIVEDLLETWPETEKQMADLKRRVVSNEMYRNLLVSEDGKFTTIVIRTQSHSSVGKQENVLEGFEDTDPLSEFSEAESPPVKKIYLTDKENSEAVETADRIARSYDAPDFTINIAGSPVVTHYLMATMVKDMRKFMMLALVTVVAMLWIMFRKISGVVLPVIITAFTLLSTVGIMAATGTAIKVPTQILPSFLLAVCVGASVHILAIFYQQFKISPDKENAIAYSMGHSGLAVLMTSLTTAAGLLSFSTADVAPIADIGIFAGIGVMLGLLYTLVLLPALLSVIPIKAFKNADRKSENKNPIMNRFIDWVAFISTTYAKTILVITVVLVIGSIWAVSTVRFGHDPLRWFPEENEIRSATEMIDHEMRGTLSLEAVIDTGKENGLYEPELLNRMEETEAYFQEIEFENLFVGKAWSVVSILKEINQALNENRSEFYAIPQDKTLIAQEILLFENSGSDDLEDFVDSRFSKARMVIKVPFEDAVRYGRFLKFAEQYFKEKFPNETVTLTGMMVLLGRTLSNTIISFGQSYIIALVVITLLMIVLIGRVRIGLLSMVPNLTPILITIGFMGVLNIKMDLFTMLVGSISIGLAVDDTIHFMHNFRRYYEESGDPVKAVYDTLHTTGVAMLVTSIVLSVGFFIFAFATMKNLFNFGILTATAISLAWAGNYFIAPALMVLVNKKKTPANGGVAVDMDAVANRLN